VFSATKYLLYIWTDYFPLDDFAISPSPYAFQRVVV